MSELMRVKLKQMLTEDHFCLTAHICPDWPQDRKMVIFTNHWTLKRAFVSLGYLFAMTGWIQELIVCSGGWTFRANVLARWLAGSQTTAWSKQTWRRGMWFSLQLCSRCTTLLVHSDYTHWPSRKCETDGERLGKMDRSGWMGSFFRRRREEGPLVLVCGRQPAAFSVYINVLILNWLWGSQRLENSWERNKKQSDRTEEHWLQNVTGLLNISGCIAFFFSFSSKWWQMFKLKWNTSKTILKWLFIGMLGV